MGNKLFQMYDPESAKAIKSVTDLVRTIYKDVGPHIGTV